MFIGLVICLPFNVPVFHHVDSSSISQHIEIFLTACLLCSHIWRRWYYSTLIVTLSHPLLFCLLKTCFIMNCPLQSCPILSCSVSRPDYQLTLYHFKGQELRFYRSHTCFNNREHVTTELNSNHTHALKIMSCTPMLINTSSHHSTLLYSTPLYFTLLLFHSGHRAAAYSDKRSS